MVECVEHLPTHLKVVSLCEVKVLRKREIDVLISRPKNNVPSGITECTNRVVRKRRRIEITLCEWNGRGPNAYTEWNAGNEIRPVTPDLRARVISAVSASN